MRQSTEITELAKAMAKFQGEVGNVKKDADNPFFKSKYADIAAILDTIRKPLSDAGLSIVQMPMIVADRTILVTRVLHASGQWLEGEWPINPVKNDPQGLGSATSYARRYSLQAALSLATEDDDGEGASGRGSPANGKDIQSRAPTKKVAPINGGDSARTEPSSEADWHAVAANIRAAIDNAKTASELGDIIESRQLAELTEHSKSAGDYLSNRARLAIGTIANGGQGKAA